LVNSKAQSVTKNNLFECLSLRMHLVRPALKVYSGNLELETSLGVCLTKPKKTRKSGSNYVLSERSASTHFTCGTVSI